MITKYYVDALGKYLGGFQGAEPPIDAIEVPAAPTHAKDVWSGKTWLVEPEQLIAQYTALIQNRLDDFAKTRGYDGILSACTYATSAIPKFKAEGQYCVGVRDTTWATGYEVMAAVKAGTRPMPTWTELELELPVLAW